MGQVTIYLEDGVEAKMRKAAKSVCLSQSKWISGLIKEKVADEWPESVLKLKGAWADLPLVDEIRKTQGSDTRREAL